MSTSTKNNLILDITIFAAFLVIVSPKLTGSTIHEWLSLALAAAIVVHLLFHWKWIVSVSKKFFKKFFHQSRLNYLVDLLLFIMMTASMFSGLMISKSILDTLGIHLDVGRSWKTLHNLTSDLSVILLGLHFALHFKWLLSTLKRYFVTPILRLFQRPQAGALAVEPVRIKKEY